MRGTERRARNPEPYIARRWRLVKLEKGEKKPIGLDWNHKLIRTVARAQEVIDKGFNLGVHLASSGLCSVDPDDLAMARKALAAFDIDLATLGALGWHVGSPREGSGGRYTFSDPGGLRWMTLRVRDEDNPKRVRILLELRAGSPNLQDVLPGSRHPAGGEWTADPLPDRLPEPPETLLALWQRWQDDPQSVEKLIYDALDVPPHLRLWDIGGESGRLAFPSPCRDAFNKKSRVEDILDHNGYTEHDGRWAHPGATGAPGCHEIPGKDGLWQSHNGGDPLRGTFDAWIAYVVLEHGYDVEKAARAFGKEHPELAFAEFQKVQPEIDADEEAEREIEALLSHGTPQLDDGAFPGLLGEIVDAACAGTESVPAFVALSTLTMLAARFGRLFFYNVGDQTISLNLFGLCAGPTGSGRKGTSAALPGRIFDQVDALLRLGVTVESWLEGPQVMRLEPPLRRASLASGEGLVHLLADDPDAPEMVAEGETQPVATTEKRLLLELSEFGGALTVASREGNTLSAVLRDAYDGKDLDNTSKKNPETARQPHVNVVGHITPQEFMQKAKNEIANGLLNRFVIVFGKRLRKVPQPVGQPQEEVTRFARAIINNCAAALVGAEVASGSRHVREVRMTRAAARLWERWYTDYDGGTAYSTPNVARLMERREAHIRKLSALLAVLNGSPMVKVEHLKAAIAWTDHMTDACEHIFSTEARIEEQRRLRADMKTVMDHLRRLGGKNVALDALRKSLHDASPRMETEQRNAALQALASEAPPYIVKSEGKKPVRGRAPMLISIRADAD